LGLPGFMRGQGALSNFLGSDFHAVLYDACYGITTLKCSNREIGVPGSQSSFLRVSQTRHADSDCLVWHFAVECIEYWL
jgi:hypothetical protein